MAEVLFSICHTTARPKGWQDSYWQWIKNAACPETVEYILTVDERWGFTELPPLAHDALRAHGEMRRGLDKAAWNTGRKCLVDGANIAAANAFGKILIINSDDFFPCWHWDVKLIAAVSKHFGFAGEVDPDTLDYDFVIRTHPGDKYQAWLDEFVTKGRDPLIGRLMTLQILSRTRYQRFGYALYPEFTSMMADTDFTEQAEHDECVIEARHIEIEHRHPFVSGASLDDVSQHENEQAAHELGARVFARRHAERMGGVLEMQPRKPKLVVFLPGSEFRGRVMQAWSLLLIHLIQRFEVTLSFSECSNQYYVRDMAVRKVRSDFANQKPPDFALWIDSDNVLTPDAFDLLADAVQAAREVSACSGWYWMHAEPPQLCARVKDPNGTIRSVTFEELQDAYDSLSLIEITDHIGFGSVFMRWEVLETAGEWPFCAIVDDQEDRPMKGDDVSFCRRAIARGYRFFLHPEVYLPHLKMMELPGPKLKARARLTHEANAAD